MTCAPFANLVEWGIWKGKDAVLKLFLTSTVFCFPSLWLWNLTLDRSTWLFFNFVFFLHWIGAAQRPSFINQFFVVIVVVVQWKAARCWIHLRPVMVDYGLAKVLRSVKALQTRKNSANGFENLNLQPFWKFLRYRRLCCCCYIISSKFVRKLRSTIEYFQFQTKVCGFFVPADMALSDVSLVESSRNLHFPAALSERNFVVFHVSRYMSW